MKIYLYEDITPSVIKRILKKIEKFYSNEDNLAEDIWIVINSDGGDFESTLGLIDYIDYHNSNYANSSAAKINTLCLGKAYSSAAFLLASGKHRSMSLNSIVMLHPVCQDIIDAPMNNIQKMVEHNKNHYENFARYMTAKCGKYCQNIFLDCAKEEIYLTAGDCLRLGLIDSIRNF
jgi:ATP-dependent protease ClpP protease subunit